MKKVLCIVLIFIILCGCDSQLEQKPSIPDVITSDYHTGVWVSYSELNTMLKGDFKLEFEALIKNCKESGITDIFVHVRAFCDAYYPSKLFPLAGAAAAFNGDLLKYMTDCVHKSSMAFHAWINPYRVRTADENIEALPENSPVRQWLSDTDAQNDINVCFSNGIYLNPASAQSRRLVIDGIRELLDNYEVDGIHFDDYFYPTAKEDFDAASYNAYLQSCEQPLKLSDWRCAQVNQLISGAYTAVKFYNKELIFSVSPVASIEKNKNELFADVEAWMKSGTVDWIIPQLYFGFNYPDSNFRFDNLLKRWVDAEKADTVLLMIGLAPYKLDTISEPDRAEWASNTEILANQVSLCKKYGTNGHIFFSSGSLFSQNETNRKALEKLKKQNNSF